MPKGADEKQLSALKNCYAVGKEKKDSGEILESFVFVSMFFFK